MKYLILISGIVTVILFSACGENSSGETKYFPTDSTSPIIPISLDSNGAPVTTTTAIPDANNINTPHLNTEQPTQTVVAGTGLNPEHGKPGHKCELAVGAPLNSAAVQQPVISQSPATNISEISAKNATIVTPSKTAAAGMNPEHGKPGHRCDIAVGAPLDSKPIEAKIDQQPAPSTNAPLTPLLPTTKTSTTTIPGTPVAAGINPEHGKPGHRCDVAVGDPLPKQ